MANNIREIITKAIISKGKKKSRNNYTFEIADLTKVLGCWITNHEFQAYFNDGQPEVSGAYYVHIWYSFDSGNNSNIYKTQISYVEAMDVSKSEERDFTGMDEIEAISDTLPKCIKVETDGLEVQVELEKEVAIRIIGDTCIRVETKDDNDDVWDSFEEFEINENFIT
ncbi:MAG: outer spore coat protein CotE [Coprobacillaceae bacterium]